mmetsp:Transcript_24206/g.55534  ORF Transcript_24206/g.55534 Transcript_24206/m.55534 type:complete len:202 (+) Transcript_24206:516-1121(+)
MTEENHDYTLEVPTPPDFETIGQLQYYAFKEKLGKGAIKKTKKMYEKYHKKYPQKLQHCRIIRSPTDKKVIACCQLMLKGDPSDDLGHKLVPGEAYLEWIACDPAHTGKGLGSKLLLWAEKCARETGNNRVLSLSVMKSNKGAVRLYERKGFRIVRDPHHDDCCDAFFESLIVFCCLGCKYWGVHYMEKPLQMNLIGNSNL